MGSLAAMWGLLAAATAPAAPPALAAPEALAWGITRPDLDGDGRRDLIVRSWRENHNAHGFSVYDLYVWRDETLHRVVVPRKGKEGYALHLASRQGADCVLRDAWLSRSGGRPVIVVAERPLGAGHAASARVTFTVYGVSEVEAAVPGMPRFSLEPIRQWASEKEYCDVFDALRRQQAFGGEWQVPSIRTGAGPGGTVGHVDERRHVMEHAGGT